MFYRKKLIDGRLESRNVEFPYSNEWEIVNKEEYDRLFEEIQEKIRQEEEENKRSETK